MKPDKSIKTLPLDGGRTCLDFTNTVSTRKQGETPYDYLVNYREWIAWCRKVDLRPAARLQKLDRLARLRPERGARALRKVISARETLFDIFSMLSDDKNPDRDVLTSFNRIMSESLSRQQFVVRSAQFELEWPNEMHLDEPLWVVLKDAYNVLTQADQHRIKSCDSCGWLFLDTTKNNKRRWCNPQVCGSQDKARRYYWRKKEKLSYTSEV